METMISEAGREDARSRRWPNLWKIFFERLSSAKLGRAKQIVNYDVENIIFQVGSDENVNICVKNIIFHIESDENIIFHVDGVKNIIFCIENFIFCV